MIVVLVGCFKIPLGDGESLKISKDGFTVSNSDGKETKVNIDKDEGKISVSSDEGEGLSVGNNADIPEEFPSDIPIPEGAIILSGITLDDEDEGRVTSVNYIYEGNFDDLVQLYQEYLSNGNFDSIEDSTTQETIAAMTSVYTKDGHEMEIIHGYKEHEVYIFQISVLDGKDHVTVNIMHTVQKQPI